MATTLSDRQIGQYRADGYLFPLPAFSRSEVAHLRTKLDELERRESGKVSARTNRKPHLLLPWLNEVIHHPPILDAVEGVIGPNILCWGSEFFAKDAHDRALVTWHQDSTYWGLSQPDVVTAWVGFTPSTVRGEDTYKNFALEPSPSFEFDPEAVAFHSRMLENNTRILYAGAERRPYYYAPVA
jgi:non-haem Fe2+, alpha-ketoglutarate-dependent halogenase